MSHKVFPHDSQNRRIAEFILGFEGNGSGPSHAGSRVELIACSNCFLNEGLRLDAQSGGIPDDSTCARCGFQTGRKLTRNLLEILAHRFFVKGTFQRCEYGAAPIVQFNERRPTDIKIPNWLEADIRLFEELLGVGFFYYGPRLWMVGEIVPLERLQAEATRATVIERILSEYPTTTLGTDQTLYRLRTNPSDSSDISQFDSPPARFLGRGRFDSRDLPIMYASQDLEVCIP